jgi:DNA-binding transcriptional MocR family regulator
MSEPIIVQTSVPPGIIDLGMGNPDFDLLPIELLHQSAEAQFATGDKRPLQYGLERGDGYFRLALADFLTTAYGKRVDPEMLFVTAGASSALDLICSLYTKPGDQILVEEPSYFLALRIFEDHGLRVIPVEMDTSGLRIDMLEELLVEHHPKFIYTIPTFQNPSGRILSKERREKLIEMAQRFNFLVVADEAYHFLPFSQTKLVSFAVFSDEVDNVISVNSFSKILAPGLRLGWIQAHKLVIDRLSNSGLLESGGGMNPFMSALVRGLIVTGGLEKNITLLRGEYTSRRDAMEMALQKHLNQAEYSRPEGGFFFWARIPGVDTAELRRKAKERKVDFRQGALFSSQMGMKEYLRLSFCFYDPDQIEDGIMRLGDCLDKE